MRLNKNVAGVKFLREVRDNIRWLGEAESKRLQKAWTLFENMSLVSNSDVLKELVKEELNKIKDRVSPSYYKDLRALINGMLFIVTNYKFVTIRGDDGKASIQRFGSVENLFQKLVDEEYVPKNIKGMQKLVARIKKYKGNFEETYMSFIPDYTPTIDDKEVDDKEVDDKEDPIKIDKHIHLDIATLSDIKKLSKEELKAAKEDIKKGLDKIFDLLESGTTNYPLIVNTLNFLRSEGLI